MTNHPYLCTLAQAKQQHKTPETQTADDDVLLALIEQASRRVDGIMEPRRRRPYFLPYHETRKQAIYPRYINSMENTLRVPGNLLSFSAVSVNGETVTGSVEAARDDLPVITELRYTTYTKTWYDQLATADTRLIFADITGIWGYHSDFDHAWETLTTVNGTLTEGATTVTVNSSTGFSPGHLIRIDDEYLTVTAVATNTLTVKRGVNGTTAAEHVDSDVDIFDVEPPVARAVARQVGLMYARRGAYQVETLDGIGSISYPQDLLSEIRGVLTEYMYV